MNNNNTLSKFKLLEMELHSFCNRKCPWCPNKEIDRTYYEEMPEEVFLNLFKDLKDNNYTGDIAFNGFSETMANPELIKKRIKQIREFLPNALIKANTNGDFITKENLDGLNINRLCINDYDCRGLDFVKEKLNSCGAVITEIDKKNNNVYAIHPYVNIIQYRIEWPKHVHLIDRAGYFPLGTNILDMLWRKKHELRTNLCTEPLYCLLIDHKGRVTPCSNIRADYEPHKEFILGDISVNKLSDIIKTEKFNSFINIIADGDYSKYPSICHYCNRPAHFIKEYNKDRGII